MRVIEPYVEIRPFHGKEFMQRIEEAGRTCYKSEGKITNESYWDFIEKIIRSGHHSVLEHEKITVRIICDRGISHEIVRHRLAAYSQESTRYCNYTDERFGREITVINPFFFKDNSLIVGGKFALWKQGCEWAESTYFSLLDAGATPQEARSVLPNSLKTEIVVTYNLREWRHFFSLRAAKPAHPQMQQIAIPLLLFMKNQLAPVFRDIEFNKDFPIEYYAEIEMRK